MANQWREFSSLIGFSKPSLTIHLQSYTRHQRTPTIRSHICFQGFVFTIPDHLTFPDSLAYKVMSAKGPVWHVYDSTCPGDQEGGTSGPEIIISSPGRANAKDMKTIRKGQHVILYLPLPSLDEIHSIRSQLFDYTADRDNYLAPDKMFELIDKFGCVPRTIFDFGTRNIDLSDIEKKLENATDVETREVVGHGGLFSSGS